MDESKNKNIFNQNQSLEELNLRLSANLDDLIKPKRKMLVFLNPIGGSGKALRIWNSVFLILSKKITKLKFMLIRKNISIQIK